MIRTLSLGIGLSIPVSRAVLRGLRPSGDPFERTPKRGRASVATYRAPTMTADRVLKVAMAALMSTYLLAAVAEGYWGQIPFILLFLSGYLALGLLALGERLARVVRGGTAQEPPPLHGQQEEEGDPERGPDRGRLNPLAGLLIAPETEVSEECEAA